jgi:hypothetical protein
MVAFAGMFEVYPGVPARIPATGDCERGTSAPGRNRTCDLALRRRALYPLSYGRGETPV